MTKDEALKLALEALETELCIDWTNVNESEAAAEKMHEAIAAIKTALAQPAQEPVAGKGKEYSEQLKLCARNVAFVSAGRVDMSSAAMQEMFALIDHVCVGIDSPPAAQPEERNFCPRCGKRRGGDVNYIHTCTPPRENT